MNPIVWTITAIRVIWAQMFPKRRGLWTPEGLRRVVKDALRERPIPELD